MEDDGDRSALYIAETPTRVKDAKGVHLITESTPNGKKVRILLEELKETYGLEFTTSLIDVDTNEQKQEWFLRINPNGRIPVIIDNTRSPPHAVMETSAELLYLLTTVDKDYMFSFEDPVEQSELIQWLIFWHASGQPNQGQTVHFSKGAKEKIPYAIARFRNETLRVYSVLEDRLSGRHTGHPREWLAGREKGKYSAADIGAWPWVRSHRFCGIEDMSDFPHLQRWILRIAEREAVQLALGEAYDNDLHPELMVYTQG